MKNRNAMLVALVVLVSFALRIWGLQFDLPYVYHPDEPVPVRIAHNMLVTGDFNPHFFDWPSLVINVNFLIQAVYDRAYHLLHIGADPHATAPLVELAMGVTRASQPGVVLAGRAATVCFGMGTVVLTMLTGRRLFRNAMTGTLAGLMVGISPTNVSLSRTITPDPYATFFVAAVIFAAVLVFNKGSIVGYLLAGASLGLAVASKYNSALAILPILAAHFLRNGLAGYKDYKLYLVMVVAAFAFAAGSPYSVLAFREFFPAFLSTGRHYASGHAGMEGNTLRWYLSYMGQTSGVLYVLAALAIVKGVRTRSKELLLVSLFPVLYFFFISTFIVRNDRTLLPITPSLLLLAAVFVTSTFSSADALPSPRMRLIARTTVVFALFVGLLMSTSRTAADTLQGTTTNSRETARRWIADNLPPGSSVVIEPYAPFVEPSQFSVQSVWRMIEHEPDWYVEHGIDYLVFGQGMYGRFYADPERYKTEVASYDALFNRFRLLKVFTDGGYEVRIYGVATPPPVPINASGRATMPIV